MDDSKDSLVWCIYSPAYVCLHGSSMVMIQLDSGLYGVGTFHLSLLFASFTRLFRLIVFCFGFLGVRVYSLKMRIGFAPTIWMTIFTRVLFPLIGGSQQMGLRASSASINGRPYAAADSACAHCCLPVRYTAHSTDSIPQMLGLPLRVKLLEQT